MSIRKRVNFVAVAFANLLPQGVLECIGIFFDTVLPSMYLYSLVLNVIIYSFHEIFTFQLVGFCTGYTWWYTCCVSE